MTKNAETFNEQRLKALDKLQDANEKSLELRTIKIGKTKVFITYNEMNKIVEILRRDVEKEGSIWT